MEGAIFYRLWPLFSPDDDLCFLAALWRFPTWPIWSICSISVLVMFSDLP